MISPDVVKAVSSCLESASDMHEKIKLINEFKILLHQHSPFSEEPVDCVLWVDGKTVDANDYNPNVMASVEKKLLERSIDMDGFTQPVVVAKQKERHLVVDGFHRQQLGKSKTHIRSRLNGYLPVTLIKSSRQGEKERISATIRHNRARGKHQIAAMSDIVRDLCRLGWKEQRISEELGMDADEVLRLKQISGLTELFADEEFSEAWTVA